MRRMSISLFLNLEFQKGVATIKVANIEIVPCRSTPCEGNKAVVSNDYRLYF